MSDQFYMTASAARAADISESTLRIWARRGLVPSECTSTGVRLFKLNDVLRVAQSRARGRRDGFAAVKP
ncbi:MAG: MerR family transcriptional regulator [Nitrospirales bacterium]